MKYFKLLFMIAVLSVVSVVSYSAGQRNPSAGNCLDNALNAGKSGTQEAMEYLQGMVAGFQK